MALIRREAAYSRITVTLPTFILITLRHLVKDANEKHPEWKEKWCVSALLERWLFDTIRKNELEHVAVNAPGFERAAKAWMRWEAQQRARRKAALRAKRVTP
ncbi:MAG TPA: hypothetical protein VF713_04410 [Thermoanaerobaculia bacterium]